MQKITPFLWFNGQAEEAAQFYVSVFRNAKITGMSRYGKTGPGAVGSVMTVTFELNGEEFIALNGGPDVPFTEAVSLVVNCDTQEEIDEYWTKLTADGGREVQCGWLQDKFGFFWQVVPSQIREWLGSEDTTRTDRMMKEVVQMVKLDLARMQAAYEGR